MGDSEASKISEMDELWQELWSEILKRIPAKELGKCISVCKTWYSLILSQPFITSHTKFHQTHLNFLLRSFTRASITENGVESYHFFSDSDEISGNFEKGVVLPFKAGEGMNFRVVGCVNGVVFLADTAFGNKYTFYLWNPLIKKHIKLPKPRIVFDVVGPYMHVFGFGYDSKTQDLKVVRVSYIQLGSGLDEIPPKAEVYSAKLGVWRWVYADDVTTCTVEDTWSQCFLQGCVHWVGFDRNDESDSSFKNNCLLVFDVEEERFRKMELPLALLEVCPIVLEVSEFKGLLSMIKYKKCGHGFEMWIQKKYDVIDSWSKVMSVDFEELKLMKVLRWRQNGEVLIHTREGVLVSYDPKTKNVKSIRNDGNFAAFYSCSFTESLVFLEKDCEKKRIVRLEEDDSVSNEDENVSSLDTIRLSVGKAFTLCYQMMKFRRDF